MTSVGCPNSAGAEREVKIIETMEAWRGLRKTWASIRAPGSEANIARLQFWRPSGSRIPVYHEGFAPFRISTCDSPRSTAPETTYAMFALGSTAAPRTTAITLRKNAPCSPVQLRVGLMLL